MIAFLLFSFSSFKIFLLIDRLIDLAAMGLTFGTQDLL